MYTNVIINNYLFTEYLLICIRNDPLQVIHVVTIRSRWPQIDEGKISLD
jgi:hypothetical protein